ncbi:LptA/OstA family protein [Kangiella koreensis]|uniref:OstA family protein n=1 Tax=Kangiella koreensis (strain DSM 16069 / JCM 12317 / KCTC 12182 / SW-125) TaxID=523791 RepID=C7R9H9_KANKD|nr:LptA/OstA family protein [Kangiella koreensis]ACV26070.1 OstA family protein [Kangiella koreensis DSM 16069]
MKSRLLMCALSLSSLLTMSFVQAATLEKSRLRSDKSNLDVQNNIIVYRDNVIYEHGNMTIHADSLTKQGENAGTITALGNPVKIHYVDVTGETTDIDAPKIVYRQQTGELSASGDIKIVQSSGIDALTLLGQQLTANQGVTEGFGFVLSGNPTEFRLEQPSQPAIFATADQLRSNGKDKQTELVGNVKLQQGDSNMKAAFLTYDGASKVISAGKNDSGEQRVETEFFWAQDNTTEQTSDDSEPSNETETEPEQSQQEKQ